MNDGVAGAANLIAEPARAAMLLELMSGRALPAGELAAAANVSAQTASGHLAKLVEGRFLLVEQQGRHRYYRLASTQIADAVEALMALTNDVRKAEAGVPQVGSLEHAPAIRILQDGWVCRLPMRCRRMDCCCLPAGERLR